MRTSRRFVGLGLLSVFMLGAGPTVEAQDSEACSLLKAAVDDLFGDEASGATLRPSSASGNEVCRVIWDIPGLDSAERTRRAVSVDLRDNNEVTLTIMGREFDSAAAAVASLEQDVETLSQGRTITVRGRERTIQRDFGDWLDGVGDKAISTGNAVMVAAGRARFTTSATTADDDADNLATGIELAERIVAGL